MSKIVSPTPENLQRAAEAIQSGQLVGMPTETVYGLACNALDDRAVARVFEAKGRPSFDPLIVHVAEIDQAQSFVKVWPNVADKLAQSFWPGPMTLVIHKRRVDSSEDSSLPMISDLVTSGLDTVGLRLPAHPVARQLIKVSGVPIAAPSANRFGRISPTTAEHVLEELGDHVAMVIDGGPSERGVESTVVSCVAPSDDNVQVVRVLRLGGIDIESIEAKGWTVERPSVQTDIDEKAAKQGLASPGMLLQHYAPGTPMIVVDDAEQDMVKRLPDPAAKRVGFLGLTGDDVQSLTNALGRDAAEHRVLSEQGDLSQAAARLFAAMRELDAMALDVIVARLVPERGLGRAINDRLRRAGLRAT